MAIQLFCALRGSGEADSIRSSALTLQLEIGSFFNGNLLLIVICVVEGKERAEWNVGRWISKLDSNERMAPL